MQGPDVLVDLAAYVKEFGDTAVVVATAKTRARVQAQIDAGLVKTDLKMVYAGFSGECTEKEAMRIVDILKSENAATVIGLGGGKAMDTAKAAGHFYDCRIVCVATIASTDAPCSHIAVLYTEDGKFDKYLPNRTNPDLVMVDTAVVAKAPTRMLIAGIGDALSTYFEARPCLRANADNNTCKGKATLTGMMIAETCYKVILEDSVKAIAASEMNVVTGALENIVEAIPCLVVLVLKVPSLRQLMLYIMGLPLLQSAITVIMERKLRLALLFILFLKMPLLQNYIK